VNLPQTGSETYVACLTPPGVAALATLALRGPDAWEIARSIFQLRTGGRLPADSTPGRFWLGRLGEEIADQAVFALKRVQPVPWVELHCHGGREVIRMILELFELRGVRVVAWPELERLTVEDPLQASAAAALAEAPTARTAAILLDQYQGAFRRAVDAARAGLADNDTEKAGRVLADLERYSNLGRHLTTPWRVTVAGAPNVGKSSLVNALAGYQRCIVTATPGTTRDVVTTLVAIDGWPVELADTAGLRSGAETLEEAGIGLARAAAGMADLCLWVVDASAPPVWPDAAASSPRIVVNKIDLPAVWDIAATPGAVAVSALTKEGLPELCQAIASWLVPEAPPAGAAVPFTPALCDQVAEVQALIAAGETEKAARAFKDA
jgi:tRNA modification GTPase